MTSPSVSQRFPPDACNPKAICASSYIHAQQSIKSHSCFFRTTLLITGYNLPNNAGFFLLELTDHPGDIARASNQHKSNAHIECSVKLCVTNAAARLLHQAEHCRSLPCAAIELDAQMRRQRAWDVVDEAAPGDVRRRMYKPRNATHRAHVHSSRFEQLLPKCSPQLWNMLL